MNTIFPRFVASSDVSLTVAVWPYRCRDFCNSMDSPVLYTLHTSCGSVPATNCLSVDRQENCWSRLHVALSDFKRGSTSATPLHLRQLEHLVTFLPVLYSSAVDHSSSYRISLASNDCSSIFVCNMYWSKCLLVRSGLEHMISLHVGIHHLCCRWAAIFVEGHVRLRTIDSSQ